MNAPPTIIFDLGGVLVRICRTWEEACTLAGIEIRDMPRFREPALVARRKHFTHLHQTGQITCLAYFDAIASSAAGLYTPDEVHRIHSVWTIEDYPGAAELIVRLNAAGYRTACLSNTNHSHWVTLRNGDRDHRPSAAVAALAHHLVSHELAAAKPDEDIYRLAEEALNTAPNDIVFFDDLEENIAAATRRGWRAHHIDHTTNPAAQIESLLTSFISRP